MYVGSGSFQTPQTQGFGYGFPGMPGGMAGYRTQAGISSSLLGGSWGNSGYNATNGSYAGMFTAPGGGLGAMTGYYLGDSYFDRSGYGNHKMNLGAAAWVETVRCETPGKMWDVWFDHADGQKTTQRSPIVLDLNGNGKADVTGANVLGNGKIDGPTALFDIDPSKSSYEFKSRQRRPGNGAPKVKGAAWVETDGVKKYVDPQGNVVGELRPTGKNGKMEYHYGKRETREQTEWLAAGAAGDGLLVWDVDKDGQITSSKELFSEFDIDGTKKFANGYEKLAAYCDKDGDGVVRGAELAGLNIWKDANADGKVDAGEMRTLAEFGITKLDVAGYDRQTMESTFAKESVSQQIKTNVWGTYGGSQSHGGQQQAHSYGMVAGGAWGGGAATGWTGGWGGSAGNGWGGNPGWGSFNPVSHWGNGWGNGMGYHCW